MKLVIVESPAKAQTISRFLPKEYEVTASYGHVRDLPGSADEIPEDIKKEPWSRMAVNVEEGYEPVYVVTKESRKHIAELKKQVKQADEVILATDEDREGESISWHLLETLKPKVPVKRIAFHEITEPAIREALANPRDLDEDLVHAQESRRVLDRLYGYSLSPVLWKKVRPKLSAGRVQSVAVRLVVEREEARKAFRSAEYWSIDAHLAAQGITFSAALNEVGGKRPAVGKDFDAATGALLEDEKTRAEVVHLDQDRASALADALQAGLPWRVARVDQRRTRQRPAPPFMTSTLQQAASSILGMSPRVTMMVAQRLYEGVDLGNGEREGLITYMRTDSLTLSEQALEEAGRVIREGYGDDYYAGPRAYQTKSRNAQEAHEAIRPTHLTRAPQELEGRLDREELALYRLIWNRAVASQMADAVLLKTTVDIEAAAGDEEAVLRANGSVVEFPGHLRVSDVSTKDTELPPLAEGQAVRPAEQAGAEDIALTAMAPDEHHTQPPARYTEASLVQRLEEEGIGRPSTYAPTISTIQQRGYVERRGKALVPTYLAVAVTKLLRDHFPQYVDLGFTARMEEALDDISNGGRDWVRFLDAFYRGNGEEFGEGLEPAIEDALPRMEYPNLPLGEDPGSGQPLVVRLGRNAPFIQRGEGGEGNTAPIPEDLLWEDLTAEAAAELLRKRNEETGEIGKHPETGEAIYARLGRYGPYLQLGEVTEENKKPRRASVPRGTALEDVSIDLAVKLLSLPRTLGQHPDSGEPVEANIGRYGPYVRCESEFRSLEDTDDVYTVGLDRALELLAQPKKSRRAAAKKVLKELGKHPESEKPVQLFEGRYGPYVSDGEVNASIPRGKDPGEVTLEEAVPLLAEARERKPARKRKAKAKAKPKRKAKPKKKAASKKKAAAKKKPAAGDEA